ncbi:RING-H2 finger protein ATL64 [Carica papaya]|uniref:RING-H2 finger protein ATL64 n=1 Tax=Carica papaya TaxID=3649 RepID=UPI000B8CCFF9|nr:RING-H2 finger protein ATL64 [Carica papaya]
MSLLVEDSSLLYKTAVVIAVVRWLLCWILRHTSSEPRRHRSSQIIKDSLLLTAFAEIRDRAPWISDTCAVCLSHLEEDDDVRELRNCCHVFHRECIDRWIDYDQDQDEDDDDESNHGTCPLCRAPLLAAALCCQTSGWAKNEPSWAVEKLLYLFGDDLN